MNAIVEIINAAGQRFVASALPMLIQSGVLILILLALDLVLRRKVRAVFRYWIWMLVLVKLVLPPSLGSPVSVGTWFGDRLEVSTTNLFEPEEPLTPEIPVVVDSIVPRPVPTFVVPAPVVETRERQAVQPADGTAAEASPPTSQIRAPAPAQRPAAALTWQGLVLLFWSAAVAALLLLLLQRAFFVQGLVAQADQPNRALLNAMEECRDRLALRGPITLKVSPNASSPAVCGLVNPVILIPHILAPKLHGRDLQAVLLHELAHVKRGDLWVNLAQTLLQIVYFYNPLLWFANAAIRRVREQAVDETVLVAMGETAPQYPETLIHVAKLAFRRRPALSLRLIGVVESKSALSARIKHILNRPIPKTAKLGLLGLLVVVLVAAVMLPMAKARPMTDRARDVLALAEEEARAFNHKYLGTEHILVALSRRSDAISGKVLENLGVDADTLRAQMRTFVSAGSEPSPAGKLAQTARARQALKRAADEARSLGHDYIGTEHLLLALMKDRESVAAQMLHGVGLTAPQVRAEILKLVRPGRVDASAADTEDGATIGEEGAPSQSVATLPNGVTIELLGVCEHPSRGKAWWRPDGSPLGEVPYDRIDGKASPDENEAAFEFAVRVLNLPEGAETRMAAEPATSAGGGSSPAFKGTWRLDELRWLVAEFGADVQTCTIRVGVATAPWQTVVRSSGREAVVEWTGQGSIEFSKARQDPERGVCITVTDHMLDQTSRVVAVTTEGRLERPWHSGASSSHGVRETRVDFPELSLADVSEFLFQTRPWTWAEFADVSLRPGPGRKVRDRAAPKKDRPTTGPATPLPSTDADGDGLSDFQEVHKYLTDPAKKDSDGDGTPDGDWNERREYAYSVRTVLRFMPPFDEDGLNDDFQDARVLRQTDDYVEIDVVHYPLATSQESIPENPNWRQDYAHMSEYLAPGVTTNWDEPMKRDLLAALKADGIDVETLTDKQVVEQVSRWLMKRSRSLDKVFTTYYVDYPAGRPRVYPGLEDAFRREFERDSGNYDWTIEQHFDHELLGKGMFYNRTHGSCTSVAVYLTTALRALGIPTRIVLVTPAVDASDRAQILMVKNAITHNRVRLTMLAGLGRSSHGWTNHTFNEVYVGNRWCRLDYSQLGCPTFGLHRFGLQTHLYTLNDLSDVNFAPTWGWRYAKGERNGVFQHDNPYAAIEVSELFGPHGNIPNPPFTAQDLASHPQPDIFLFYPARVNVWQEFVGLVEGGTFNKTGRPHQKEFYENLFDGIWLTRPQDILVLLFSLDASERIPEGYEDLLPTPWPEIEAALKRGETVELSGRAREMNIILLAAATSDELKSLVQNAKLLSALRKPGAPPDTKTTTAPSGRVSGASKVVGIGPAWEALRDRVGKRYGGTIGGFSEDEKQCSEYFAQVLSWTAFGDTFVLMFAFDQPVAIPSLYADLLPLPWPEVESRVEKGEPVEAQGKARNLNVVLLAAPTFEQLNTLVRQTHLLDMYRVQSKSADLGNQPTLDAPQKMARLVDAVRRYADEHAGELPPAFAVLPRYLGDRLLAGWLGQNVAYVGRGKIEDLPAAAPVVIAYEKVPQATGERYVAFLDGRIELMRTRRLRELGIEPSAQLRMSAAALPHSRLEFRIAPRRDELAVEILDECRKSLVEVGPPGGGEDFAWLLVWPRVSLPTDVVTQEHSDHTYLLVWDRAPSTMIPGADWRLANVGTGTDNQGRATVELELDERGGEHLRQLTAANSDHALAFVIDGWVVYAPRIRGDQPFGRKAVIVGDFPDGQAGQWANRLRKGMVERPAGSQHQARIVLPEVDREPVLLDLAASQLVSLTPTGPASRPWDAIQKLGKGDLLYDCDQGGRTLILVRDATSEQAREVAGEPFEAYLIGPHLPEVLTITRLGGSRYRIEILAADDKGCTLQFSAVPNGRGASGGALAGRQTSPDADAASATPVVAELPDGDVGTEETLREQVQFGPSVERVLGRDATYIDLERGITPSPPSDLGPGDKTQALLQWCRSNAIDAIADPATGSLNCLDAQVVELNPDAWTSLSVGGLRQAVERGPRITSPPPVDGLPVVSLQGAGRPAATYGLRTRTGTLGLLQIVDTANPQDGGLAFVKIRYRLALAAIAENAAPEQRELWLGLRQYLDLDTGRFVDVAPGEATDPNILTSRGVDLYLTVEPFTANGPSVAQIQALQLEFARTPARLYLQEIAADQVRESLQMAVRQLDKPKRVTAHVAEGTYAFRTVEGTAGVFRVIWARNMDVPRCMLQYRLIPELDIPRAAFSWGAPTAGRQCRLRAPQRAWRAGETATLSLDVRNQGKEALRFLPVAAAQCELEVDGAWYGWAEPLVIGTPVRVLEPGTELNDALDIRLTDSWALPADGVPLTFAPGMAPRWDRRLVLTPGRHAVRVRFYASENRLSPDAQGLSVISNPVEIAILSPEESASEGTQVGPGATTGGSADDGKKEPFSVYGTVTDASGRPMAGVEVTAHCGFATLMPTGRTVTDKAGRYTLHFKPGILSREVLLQAATVCARKVGFYEASLCRQGHLAMAGRMPSGEDQQRIARYAGVVLPNKPHELDFVMRPAARIEGELVDAQDKPLSVRAFSRTGEQLALTGEKLYPSTNVLAATETDQNGAFVVESVPLESFWFEYGRRTPVKSGSIHFTTPGTWRIRLQYDESQRPPRLRLAAVQPPASRPAEDDGGHVAKLPNGVTVRFLAYSQLTAGGLKWWNAEGEPASIPGVYEADVEGLGTVVAFQIDPPQAEVSASLPRGAGVEDFKTRWQLDDSGTWLFAMGNERSYANVLVSTLVKDPPVVALIPLAGEDRGKAVEVGKFGIAQIVDLQVISAGTGKPEEGGGMQGPVIQFTVIKSPISSPRIVAVEDKQGLAHELSRQSENPRAATYRAAIAPERLASLVVEASRVRQSYVTLRNLSLAPDRVTKVHMEVDPLPTISWWPSKVSQALSAFADALDRYMKDQGGRLPASLAGMRGYLPEDNWLVEHLAYIAKDGFVKSGDWVPVAYDKTLLPQGKGAYVVFAVNSHSLVQFKSPKQLAELSIPADSAAGTETAPDTRHSMLQLGLAITMYANDHNGNLPATLSPLAPYLSDPGVLAWLDKNVIYTGKGDVKGYSAAHSAVIAYERTPRSTGERYVLFLDAHVELLGP